MKHVAAIPPKPRGVHPVQLKSFADERGILTFADFHKSLAFVPKRHFVVSGPLNRATERGGHAHRRSRLILQCLAGRIDVEFDDGLAKCTVALDGTKPGHAVLVDTMVWAELKYSPGSVLLALCSEEHDEGDYIRDYSVFLDELKSKSQHLPTPVPQLPVLRAGTHKAPKRTAAELEELAGDVPPAR